MLTHHCCGYMCRYEVARQDATSAAARLESQVFLLLIGCPYASHFLCGENVAPPSSGVVPRHPLGCTLSTGGYAGSEVAM